MSDIERTIDQHRYEIDSIKESVGTMSKSMTDCTMAMRELTTQFAIYTERHDGTEKTLKAVLDAQKETTKIINIHGLDIAAMKPTVESVRGLVWKVVTASVCGAGGAFIIAYSAVN